MKLKDIALLGLLIWPLLSASAFADRSARPGSADARVKTLTYHENDVYRLQGHYGFTTVIEFSEKERIETIAIGDSESWQITKPSRPNILFIKPLEQNAETNMTILTSRHIYSFEMAAYKASSPQSSALTFRVKFIYPAQMTLNLPSIRTDQSKGLRNQEGSPVSSWNFDYSYSGAKRLKPARVFDDGKFTYFQLNDFESTPAVFAVDEQGNESIVNFTIQGRYLVVNKTGRQFTLRDGQAATCIFNDDYKGMTGTEKSIVAIEDMEQKSFAGAIPVPSLKPATKQNRQVRTENEGLSFLAFFQKNGAQKINYAHMNN